MERDKWLLQDGRAKRALVDKVNKKTDLRVTAGLGEEGKVAGTAVFDG